MDDEIVPADCFLLSSGVGAEDEDANGQCFIATSSLDGERNLKPKMAIKELEQDFNITSDVSRWPAWPQSCLLLHQGKSPQTSS